MTTTLQASKHCIRRYAERINGITDELEIARFITLEGEKVNEKLNKMITYAKLIYRGQIGTDKTTCNFYLRDDIVLVVDANNTTIITLYRIDFGFPQETNKKVIKDLVLEIENLNEQLTAAKEQVVEQSDGVKHEIEQCDQEIKTLESQLAIVRERRKLTQGRLEGLQLSPRSIQLKIDDYANKLCNSLDFKKDISSTK